MVDLDYLKIEKKIFQLIFKMLFKGIPFHPEIYRVDLYYIMNKRNLSQTSRINEFLDILNKNNIGYYLHSRINKKYNAVLKPEFVRYDTKSKISDWFNPRYISDGKIIDKLYPLMYKANNGKIIINSTTINYHVEHEQRSFYIGDQEMSALSSRLCLTDNMTNKTLIIDLLEYNHDGAQTILDKKITDYFDYIGSLKKWKKVKFD